MRPPRAGRETLRRRSNGARPSVPPTSVFACRRLTCCKTQSSRIRSRPPRATSPSLPLRWPRPCPWPPCLRATSLSAGASPPFCASKPPLARMRTPEPPRIPRRDIASNHTMAVARTRVLLTSHPLQGRRRLLHPELPRRERGRQEGLEHAGLLFHPHVRYVASVPKPRAHSASAIQASAVLTTNAVMALAVTYLPLFLPPRPGMPGSATEAPAPVPPQ